MITVSDIKVELRAPGWAWWTLPKSQVSNKANPIDEIEVMWTRATPRDHPDAGAISITLLVPPGAMDRHLIVYDAQVKVSVRLTAGGASTAWLEVANGWVESYVKTTRDLDGWEIYRIQLMDIIGRAGATKLGMTPRLREGTTARMTAINAASRAGQLVDVAGASTFGQVGPRDVDNYNALELIRETMPLTHQAVAGPDGLIVAQASAKWVPKTSTSNQGLVFDTQNDDDPALVLPSALVADVPRLMSRAGLVNVIKYRIMRYDPDATPEVEGYVNATVGSFSESRLTLATDYAYQPSKVADIVAWMADIVAQASTPKVRLDQTRILVRDAGQAHLDIIAQLVQVLTREAAVLYLAGAPDDVEPIQIMTGATLVIRGKKLRLEGVELHPGTLFGMRPVRWRDVPSDARMRPSLASLRFSDLKLMTLDPPQL